MWGCSLLIFVYDKNVKFFIAVCTNSLSGVLCHVPIFIKVRGLCQVTIKQHLPSLLVPPPVITCLHFKYNLGENFKQATPRQLALQTALFQCKGRIYIPQIWLRMQHGNLVECDCYALSEQDRLYRVRITCSCENYIKVE